jgi:uncharacterized protein YodC (DUF2158 family)
VSKFSQGDMVVLISGSMRMAVESVEDETVNVVWCHEGRVGRDSFNEKLLNKWEFREDRPQHDRGPRQDRGGRDDRGGGHRGGRDRDDHRGGPRERDDNRGGDRPRGKTGFDGRPREKKYFRKDD